MRRVTVHVIWAVAGARARERRRRSRRRREVSMMAVR
jgi:hypothetical protein